MNRGRPRHNDVLTPREWDVLACIREGLTNEEIADRLGITHNTVKYHVTEILGKLQVSSREEAAAWRGKPKVAFGLGPITAVIHKLAAVGPWKLGAGGAIAAGVAGLALLAAGVILTGGNTSMGKIAFVRDGNIWVQQLPDGVPYQFTDKGNSSSPHWSPDGNWLLYTTNPVRDGRGYLEQYIIRQDGSDERKLDTETFVSGWLPDNDDRLWYFGQDGATETENADGSDHEVLSVPVQSKDPEVQRFRFPTFGDDGRIFYIEVRFPEGTDPKEASTDEATYYGIWVSNPDGSDAHALVEANPRDDERIFPMRLSADGSQILYGTLPPISVLEGEDDADALGGITVYAAPIDGGDPRQLFEANLFINGLWAQEGQGADVAVVTGKESDSWTNKRIALLTPDASNLTFLTEPDVTAISPAWSSDGKQIAYVSGPALGPDGRSDALNARRLWVMNADGSNKRQLTLGEEHFRDETPMWSEDGKHILFARLRQGEYCDGDRYELWMYSFDDGSVTEVNDHLAMSDWVLHKDDPSFVSLCKNSTPYQRDPQGSANTSQYLDWWQAGSNR